MEQPEDTNTVIPGRLQRMSDDQLNRMIEQTLQRDETSLLRQIVAELHRRGGQLLV